MKTILHSLAALLAATALAGSAYAIPTLTLNDGAGHSVSVTDGGTGDSNSASGAVTWSGALGAWTVNVSTGISDSPNGVLGMDLNTVDKSTGSGSLTITFSDNNFTLPAVGGSLLASIGGTQDNGNLNYQTFYNGSAVTSTNQTFTTKSFSGNAIGSLGNYVTPYSLKQVLVIKHTAAGTTSLDAEASIPDGGTTALLLGLGLIGVYFVSNRRKQITA